MSDWMAKKLTGRSRLMPSENSTGIRLHESTASDIRVGENGDKAMGAKQLLIESNPVVMTLVEGTGGKTVARGEFGRVDVPTDNGRIYPRKLMEREIKRLSESLKSRRVVGEMDHPSDGKTSLKRVSHVITKLEITEDGIVMGEAEILNTYDGKNLKALIEGGVQVGVSSRGFGTTAPVGTSEAEEVQEDFVLKTYDFVAEPAMKSAVPGIYTEDVDDPTIAKMFLEEFPEVAETIRKGGAEVDALVEEKSEEKKTRKEIEDQVRAELSEGFERQLRDALVAQRDEVEAQLREEIESDPDLGAAKSVLAAIAEMVGAYAKAPDEDTVRAALKAKDLEVAEARSDCEKAENVAKKAAFALHVERKIGRHPMATSIRKLMQGRDFETLKEADAALDAILKDYPKADDVVTKEEAKTRVENAELRGQIALLESKVEELEAKTLKAMKLNERIDEQRRVSIEEADKQVSEMADALEQAQLEVKKAQEMVLLAESKAQRDVEAAHLRVYKLEKVVGLPNGRKLLGLMESVQDREAVDRIVAEEGVTRMSDPELERMKQIVKGRFSKGMQLEEDTRKSGGSKLNELGQDMDDLAVLSGIAPDV